MDKNMPSPTESRPVATSLDRLDGQARAEYWAALALRRCKGLGARSVCLLLRHFGSAYKAVHSVPQWREAGVPPSRGAGLSGRDWRRDARPEWEDSRDLDGQILLWPDPRYPSPLRELPDAPALLYARGDISLLDNPCLAVVGSRACSPKNLHLARDIARELSAYGLTVVSGMARGIDHAAHSGAISEKGRSIAVLGTGLDVVYPPRHRDLYEALSREGLLLSEFPPGSLPERPHFPIRNRIISGLSLGVLVVEAGERSGSLITARQALEQNRAVYAVPAAVHDLPGRERGWERKTPAAPDGCSQLLEQGALPVLCAADILADLSPQLLGTLEESARAIRAATPAPPPPPSSPGRASLPAKRGTGKAARPSPGKDPDAAPPPAPETREGQILAALRSHGPLHPCDMLPLLPLFQDGDGQGTGRLSALLLVLEVQGLVRRLPGMVYEAL
jgi:DNA processing protein